MDEKATTFIQMVGKKELYSFKKFREREIAFIQIIDEKGSTFI
jgi:hypothetical protein